MAVHSKTNPDKPKTQSRLRAEPSLVLKNLLVYCYTEWPPSETFKDSKQFRMKIDPHYNAVAFGHRRHCCKDLIPKLC